MSPNNGYSQKIYREVLGSLCFSEIMIPSGIIHLLSGGMDSTVLLYELKKQGHFIHCLLFDYGQTHLKELRFAKMHCERLKVDHSTIELFRIKGLFSKSALTDGKSDSVIVPNRNSVFLNIAASIAQSAGANMVTIACNKDDQTNFPDCRWEFINKLNECLKVSGMDVEVCVPYIGLTKYQIAKRAEELHVDLNETWSCYTGNHNPCGVCEACQKRKFA